MAKRKGSTKGLIGIPINATLTLSTLASGVVIANNLFTGASTVGKRIWWYSFKGFVVIRDVIPGEGPLVCGVAHSDLTNAEIAAKLDASVSSPDDITAREEARRPVRQWGVFATKDADEYLNNETSLENKKKVKFSTGEGFEPSIWVRNQGGATLTTGAVVRAFGTLWGKLY